MFFKKKSIQQEFNDIADKYKDKNVEAIMFLIIFYGSIRSYI